MVNQTVSIPQEAPKPSVAPSLTYGDKPNQR